MSPVQTGTHLMSDIWPPAMGAIYFLARIALLQCLGHNIPYECIKRRILGGVVELALTKDIRIGVKPSTALLARQKVGGQSKDIRIGVKPSMAPLSEDFSW